MSEPFECTRRATCPYLLQAERELKIYDATLYKPDPSLRQKFDVMKANANRLYSLARSCRSVQKDFAAAPSYEDRRLLTDKVKIAETALDRFLDALVASGKSTTEFRQTTLQL